MTTAKKNWIDEDSEGSGDEGKTTEQVRTNPTSETTESQQPSEDRRRRSGQREYKPRGDRNDRNQERAKQRQQQLQLIEDCQNDKIWMFVFKSNRINDQELEEAVRALESVKVLAGEKGFDILLEKENAKKFVIHGFKPKRIFAKIVFGKKNNRDERQYRGERYDRPDRRDNQRNDYQKRKYVEKEEGVKNEFTYQKKPRNRNQDNEVREKEKEKEKERKQADRYKNDPAFQGLGNFRNKEVVNRQALKQPQTKAPTLTQTQSETQPQTQKQPEIKRVESNNVRRQYKEKEVQPKKKEKSQSSKSESPDAITPYTREAKKPNKDRAPQRSNNPFDALE